MKLLQLRSAACCAHTYSMTSSEETYLTAFDAQSFSVILPSRPGFPHQTPGHLGHVELAVSVYNPLLFPILYKLYRTKCLNCHKLRLSRIKTRTFAIKLALIDSGDTHAAQQLDIELKAATLETDVMEGDKELLPDSDKKADEVSTSLNSYALCVYYCVLSSLLCDASRAAGMCPEGGLHHYDTFKRHKRMHSSNTHSLNNAANACHSSNMLVSPGTQKARSCSS